MKILFTQFTPPFAQHQGSATYSSKGASDSPEGRYLAYSDWYSNLRKLLAERDTVKLVSLTKGDSPFSIEQDGYESRFFPVENPDEEPINGRWDFFAPGLVDWVREYDPDVVHIVGTGHRMGAEIMRAGYSRKTCLWERTRFRDFKARWEEFKLARSVAMPTEAAKAFAAPLLPGREIINFPFGANLTLFRPDPFIEKEFDIMNVGYTSNKQSRVVMEIAKSNNLSWLVAGGINKDWPFTPLDNALFMGSLRKKLGLRRVKTARGGRHTCGFFPNTEMPALYNSAKVFVHPSLAEGAPRCVHEALACEVPVVVLKSTVPYVEADFAVACDSPDEFEGAVMELLGDDEKRRRMGRRGREWLEANHSPVHQLEAVSVLNERLAGAAATPPSPSPPPPPPTTSG